MVLVSPRIVTNRNYGTYRYDRSAHRHTRQAYRMAECPHSYREEANGAVQCIQCGMVLSENDISEEISWENGEFPGHIVHFDMPQFPRPTGVSGAYDIQARTVAGLAAQAGSTFEVRAASRITIVQKSVRDIASEVKLPAALMKQALATAARIASLRLKGRRNWSIVAAAIVFATARSAGVPILLRSTAVRGVVVVIGTHSRLPTAISSRSTTYHNPTLACYTSSPLAARRRLLHLPHAPLRDAAEAPRPRR